MKTSISVMLLLIAIPVFAEWQERALPQQVASGRPNMYAVLTPDGNTESQLRVIYAFHDDDSTPSEFSGVSGIDQQFANEAGVAVVFFTGMYYDPNGINAGDPEYSWTRIADTGKDQPLQMVPDASMVQTRQSVENPHSDYIASVHTDVTDVLSNMYDVDVDRSVTVGMGGGGYMAYWHAMNYRETTAGLAVVNAWWPRPGFNPGEAPVPAVSDLEFPALIYCNADYATIIQLQGLDEPLGAGYDHCKLGFWYLKNMVLGNTRSFSVARSFHSGPPGSPPPSVTKEVIHSSRPGVDIVCYTSIGSLTSADFDPNAWPTLEQHGIDFTEVIKNEFLSD